MSLWFVIGTLVFIIISIVLVLIILVQRPQGGGLAGAFGGAGGGGTDTAFGGRTGDVLTMATCVVFAVFLLLAVGLNIMDNPKAPTPADGTTTPIVNDSGGAPVLPSTPIQVPTSDGGSLPVGQPIQIPPPTGGGAPGTPGS